MALSPTNDAALLQEVDEAVRKDRLSNIWSRFGLWIVAAVVAAMLAFGGWLYWGHLQDSKRGSDSEALVAALDKLQSNQPRAATADLVKLQADGDDAYRAIALIQQANLKSQDGDTKAAAALLAKIVADTKIDSSLRDMALIRQTAIEFDSLNPATVIARMKPIVDAKDPQSSWFPSAAELSAVAHYQLGQFAEAGSLYGRIAKVDGVPESLKSRAGQMAGMLGVDAVDDRAEESAAKDKTDGTAVKAAPAPENGKAK